MSHLDSRWGCRGDGNHGLQRERETPSRSFEHSVSTRISLFSSVSLPNCIHFRWSPRSEVHSRLPIRREIPRRGVTVSIYPYPYPIPLALSYKASLPPEWSPLWTKFSMVPTALTITPRVRVSTRIPSMSQKSECSWVFSPFQSSHSAS